MNSSTLMFSNMFSDSYFSKHCKWQSLLLRSNCGAPVATRSLLPVEPTAVTLETEPERGRIGVVATQPVILAAGAAVTDGENSPALRFTIAGIDQPALRALRSVSAAT